MSVEKSAKSGQYVHKDNLSQDEMSQDEMSQDKTSQDKMSVRTKRLLAQNSTYILEKISLDSETQAVDTIPVSFEVRSSWMQPVASSFQHFMSFLSRLNFKIII